MTFEEFIKALSEDAEKMNQFGAKIDAVGELSDEEKAAEASRIAGELGFDVPASEFALQLINAAQELDDEELAKVAGGYYGHSQGEYCTFAYACVAAFQNCVINNECVAGASACKHLAGPCKNDDMLNTM